MDTVDTFVGAYTQLEFRDKINKVFQNLFRCLADVSDETAIKALRFVGPILCGFSDAEQYEYDAFQSYCDTLSQDSDTSSAVKTAALEKLRSQCPNLIYRARIWKAVSFKIGQGFESARLFSWFGKSLNDFRSIYKQLLPDSFIPSILGGGVGVGACKTLINGGSVWSDDPLVRMLFIISRTSMAIRWTLENVRLGHRIRDFFWTEKEDREEVKKEERTMLTEASANKFAKQFWVGNCLFAFLAEAVRILKFLSTSDAKERAALGGSLKTSLIALWFYFADVHASSNMCGYRKDSEFRIGGLMTLAALTQLYNMWPTAELRYKMSAISA